MAKRKTKPHKKNVDTQAKEKLLREKYNTLKRKFLNIAETQGPRILQLTLEHLLKQKVSPYPKLLPSLQDVIDCIQEAYQDYIDKRSDK